MKRIAIIGSALGGGAAQIIEALTGNNDLQPLLIFDRDMNAIGATVHGVPVVAPTEDVGQWWGKKAFDAAVVAIGGDLNERKAIFESLAAAGIETANVIDTDVRLGMNVTIGKGNVILNRCYIGNDSRIGDNNYILNQCSIQHDTVIGNHNYLATNVSIGAKVRIGCLNRLGIKSVVESRASISDGLLLRSAEIVHYNK